MSNSSLVHVFEQRFRTSELLDKFRLKDQAMFDGSVFNVDPRELQVTCRRVYNDDVWLYESYFVN